MPRAHSCIRVPGLTNQCQLRPQSVQVFMLARVEPTKQFADSLKMNVERLRIIFACDLLQQVRQQPQEPVSDRLVNGHALDHRERRDVR